MRRVLDEALISPLSSYVQLLRASSNTQLYLGLKIV
jgi:hypothetical protein